jgi:hypothetical protein
MVPAEGKPVHIAEFLALVAYASKAEEWMDWINYLE